MTNVEKKITYSPTGNTDSNDRSREIDDWNIEHARHVARQQGIDISDSHLDVIRFLRHYYVNNGWPKRTHELSRKLDKAYKDIKMLF